MTIPRRYRVALRVYPAGYRASRGRELLATLADGDDDRGRPSTREAAALACRGLIMRGRLAVSPEGLLVTAAILLMAAVMGWFAWAERVFLLDGHAAAFALDAPVLWWALALGISAFMVVAVGPFRALDTPRRRTAAVLFAFPLAIAIFTSPGRIFTSGVPDAATVIEFLWWLPGVVFHNWQLTVPASIGAVLGTWITLGALGSLSPPARRRALGRALVILGAVAVAQAWQRPELPAEYRRSAFADLEPATFIAAAGLLLALAALWRMHPRAPNEPIQPRPPTTSRDQPADSPSTSGSLHR